MSMAIHPDPEPRRRRRRGKRPWNVAVIGLAYLRGEDGNPESYWRNAGKSQGSGFQAVLDDPGLDELADVAREALDDAGVRRDAEANVALILGRERSEEAIRPVIASREQAVAQSIAIMRALHPEWSDDDLDALRSELINGRTIATSRSQVTAATLAERLNLRGSLAAWDVIGSSLVAIERGGLGVARGEAELGLVVSIDARDLAITGVVLKRLEHAEGDGDRIYAVIKNLATTNPTRRRTARPNDAIERLGGSTTATVARRVEGASPLLTAAISLHHRVLTPERDEPGPDEPVSVRPWIHGDGTRRRRARIEAVGDDGRQVRAILEEHAPSADGHRTGWLTNWETEAILTGADDRRGWVEVASALLSWLDAGSNARVSLKDLAATLNRGQSSFRFRVGMVVATVDELRDRLRSTITRLCERGPASIRDARGTYLFEEPLAGPGRLAFLYPGEGSQYPGMLADLCPHFPEVRKVLDACDRIASERSHRRRPSEILFGRRPADDADLWSIGTAVNVVLSTQWAIHQLLSAMDLAPDAVVGHSAGEILALAAAGVFHADRALEDRLGELGSLFESLEASGKVPEATLVAVAADRGRVESVIRDLDDRDRVIIAIDN
ncbi:MAG: acyltransferase domain-containing protein, partial [Isosphaeraceae bacterium]